MALINLKPGTDLRDVDLTLMDLTYADLRGADLRGALLTGANVTGINLRGALLTNTDLQGIKGYQDSSEIFFEIVRRQEENFFDDMEWIIMSKVMIYNFCWKDIINFRVHALFILKKIADMGWSEYYDKYKSIMENLEKLEDQKK